MKLERSWGVLFALLLCATTALALPLTIDSVELDEVRLDSGSVNRLDVERDDDFTLRIKLTPTAQLDNVEILAFISGYEHNDRPNERISDVAELFTADANVSYVRKLKLQLPNELDRDDYKIRLIVSDRFGTAVVQDFDLHVNSQRHDVLIKDITTIPNVVRTGGAVLVKVRVDNKGQRVENDVRVSVAIPALGVHGVDYIDRVKSEDEEETEEIFLRLPRCSKPGLYEVVVTTHYSDNRRSSEARAPINVIQDASCEAPSVQKEENKPVLQIQPQPPVAPHEEPPKRGVLEIILLTLVGLLALLGLAIAISKL